jgi:superfamily II DNA or RNA helicase
MLSIFQQRYANWTELETAISGSTDSGTAFEQFIYFFLLYYRDLYRVKDLFCPKAGAPIPVEIQKRLRLEGRDHGVDGVWVTPTNEYVAYQVKFRTGRISPTATELSTFWSEAEYADGRYTVANCSRLPKVAGKKKSHLSILVDKFDELPGEFFEALHKYARSAIVIKPEQAQPRDYQKEIVNSVVSALQSAPRGKIIAACGTGKTLLSLWITEQISPKVVLFLAPNLTLIRQTLQSWELNARNPFEYLCVCSDETVVGEPQQDEIAIRFSELDIPVTTSAKDVSSFLRNHNGPGKFRAIFSTYQSLDVIADAVKAGQRFSFDLIIFDEAHRTAGLRDGNNFSLALRDAKVLAAKRLFMTATERLVRPRTKRQVRQADQIIFSMDDAAVYGATISKLSFGEAIKKGIISDYRIVIAGALEEDTFKSVARNRYVTVPGHSEPIPCELIFQRELLRRAIRELGIRKIITYHSSVRRARQFAELMAATQYEVSGRIFVGHVNGAQSASERHAAFRSFELADLGILTNVRCLAEGVDIPFTDAVFFSDPKNSLIDIVQAIGRALRQRYGTRGKTAYIVIPVLIDDIDMVRSAINEERFESAFSAIQAMREQDEALAEWIDSVNLSAVRGAARRHGPGKIKFILPTKLNVDEFADSLVLKIADVNRNPSSYIGIGSSLGKGQRISAYSRIFKTLGDYNPEPYFKSLVLPTLNLFRNVDDFRPIDKLRINNNNVSHSVRLGVIELKSPKTYSLTPLGRLLWSKKLSFERLFMNQMMLFSIEARGRSMFPYRTTFKVLSEIGQMNYIEFLYGVYSIQPEMDEKTAISFVVEAVNHIRSKFPRIELTNAKNQEAVRSELNRNHPMGFSEKEVWTDRTTSGNQFRYFANHLALFSGIVSMNWSNKILACHNGAASLIPHLLKESIPESGDFRSAYGNWLWIKK